MLGAILKQRITAEGFVSVAEYMSLCLHHKEHGYYRTAQVLGQEGDFITAPEISPVFGEMLGLWVAGQWQALGCPASFTLLELGPGSGQLMQDMLRAAGKLPGFLEAAQVHLLEMHPQLKQQQAAKLAHLPRAPIWLHADEAAPLAALPRQPLILVANEFLDALPIRQLQFENGRWRERIVVLSGEKPAFAVGEVVAEIPEMPALRPPKEGDILEIGEDAARRMHHVLSFLQQEGGAALWLDYGYEKADYGDSLQALQRHRMVDALTQPGQCDLTAHVNFAALAKQVQMAGLHAELTTQGSFLRSLGIEIRTQLLARQTKDEAAKERVYLATERLIAPDKMGHLFKVLEIAAP